MAKEDVGTAYHEAGHAVAALLLGVGFANVSIEEDENSLGRIGHRKERRKEVLKRWGLTLLEAGYAGSHGGFIDARTRRRVEKSIMTSLAGGETEMQHTGAERYEVGAGIEKLTPQEAEDLKKELGEEVTTLIQGGDMGTALDYAYRVSGSDEEAFKYVDWLLERVRSLMGHPLFWPTVEALVKELLERRTVSYRRAKGVLEEVRQGLFPDLLLRPGALEKLRGSRGSS